MAFTRRNWIMLGVFLGLLILIGAPFWYLLTTEWASGGTGSMTQALKLRPVVEAMAEPEKSFRDRDKEAVGLRFPNGEWVVGVAKDSHALYSEWFGGGTIVLKDSRGRVRCFFGHVCGSGSLRLATDEESLDGFDTAITKNFTEQKWP